MNQRRLCVALVLGLTGCQDWEQALAECRDAGGCRRTSANGAALVIEPDQFDFGGVVPTEQVALPFSVRNVGVGPAAGIVLFDPTNSLFTVSGACSGAILAPEATCSAEVRFAPTEVGPQAGEFSVGGDGVEPVTAALTGEGVLPLAIEPSTFDFGVVPVNTPARTSFVITNRSTTSSTGNLGYVQTAGWPGNNFTFDAGTCRGAVPAGADCSLEISFTPREAGVAYDAGLRIVGANLPPRPREEVTLSVFGQSAAGLGLSPLTWSPVVEAGDAGTQVFTVSNSLTTPVGPLTVSLTQSDAGAFTLSAGCAAVTLDPTQSCTVSVDYRPLTGPAHSADLVIAGSGSIATARISGLSPRFITTTVSPVPDGGTVEVQSIGLSCPGGACSLRVPVNTTLAQVTAVPAAGMELVSWNALPFCPTITNPCFVTQTADATFSATFRRQRVPLTLQASDGGSLRYAGEFSNTNGTCPPACDAGFEPGEHVLVTAVAQPGNALAGWSGDCLDGNWTHCRLRMDSPRLAQATFSSANVAFVASAPWPGSGTASADQHCRAAAADAGLPGASTYVAWLEGSRLQSNGWVRADGNPFADSQADLLSSPPRFHGTLSQDEWGVGVQDNVSTYTGTLANGSAAGDCTSNTEILGNPYAGNEAWTQQWSNGTCTNITNPKIYCFGNFDAGVYRPPAIPPWGRRVFVSLNARNGNTSTAAMDGLCNAEAQDAGLAGTYLGLRAAVGVSMVQRFNFDGGGWFRPDGTAVFARAAHAQSTLFVGAPINLTAQGVVLPAGAGACVWLGAYSPTQIITGASNFCGDWSNSTTGDALGGVSAHHQDMAFASPLGSSSNISCGTDCHFYCFEQ